MEGWRHRDFQRPVSESEPVVFSMLGYPVVRESKGWLNELAQLILFINLAIAGWHNNESMHRCPHR